MWIAMDVSLSVQLEIIFERSVLQWKIGMLMNTQKVHETCWTLQKVHKCLIKLLMEKLTNTSHVKITQNRHLLEENVLDQPHFSVQHYVTKDNAENLDLFVCVFHLRGGVVLQQFLPLAVSWLTIDCLYRKVNKSARNLWVPAKDPDLTRHQWKMLITMKGPKLNDTECSAVIHQFCTEICNRHKKQNCNWICAGFFFKKFNHCQCV